MNERAWTMSMPCKQASKMIQASEREMPTPRLTRSFACITSPDMIAYTNASGEADKLSIGDEVSLYECCEEFMSDLWSSQWWGCNGAGVFVQRRIAETRMNADVAPLMNRDLTDAAPYLHDQLVQLTYRGNLHSRPIRATFAINLLEQLTRPTYRNN